MPTECSSDHSHTCVCRQRRSCACSAGESPTQEGNTASADTAAQQLPAAAPSPKACIKRLLLTSSWSNGCCATYRTRNRCNIKSQPAPRLTPSLSASAETVITWCPAKDPLLLTGNYFPEVVHVRHSSLVQSPCLLGWLLSYIWGAGFCSPLFPYVSRKPITKILMIFSFFLHFDFCSTRYNSVSKFSSSFWF